MFIGGCLGPFITGPACDKLGRRPVIFWGSVVTIIGVIIQTAANGVAMFVVARIILGFGNIISGIAAGVYLSETFASRWRAWGVGLLNDFYYVGALLAAGVTLGKIPLGLYTSLNLRMDTIAAATSLAGWRPTSIVLTGDLYRIPHSSANIIPNGL